MPRGATDGETAGDGLQSLVGISPRTKERAKIEIGRLQKSLSLRMKRNYLAAPFLCRVEHM